MPRGGITLPFLSSRCCCWKRNWKLNFHQDITIYQSRLLVVGGTKLRKSLMNTHLSIFSTTGHLFGGHGVMPSNSLWSQMGSKRNIEGKSMNELKEKSHGLIKHKTGLRWHRKLGGNAEQYYHTGLTVHLDRLHATDRHIVPTVFFTVAALYAPNGHTVPSL